MRMDPAYPMDSYVFFVSINGKLAIVREELHGHEDSTPGWVGCVTFRTCDVDRFEEDLFDCATILFDQLYGILLGKVDVMELMLLQLTGSHVVDEHAHE